MQKLTYTELARQVLREVGRPLAPSEIWKFAVSKGYEKSLNSQGKTPAQTLYTAIYLDERDNKSSKFVKYDTQPVRYFLKELAEGSSSNELNIEAASEPSIPQIYQFKEAQLHQFLSYFIFRHFNARAKTIRHNISNKKEYGEWVHPDMIAVGFPSWRSEVGELSMRFGEIGIQLFSFEIKRALTFSNLREAFFQAVSNSSWAHEGYLASADISTDADFRDELRRLSITFGIGIISLDVEDPDASEILIPPKDENSIDWDSLNKLAKLNADTAELLDQVNKAIQIKDFSYGTFDGFARPEPLRGIVND